MSKDLKKVLITGMSGLVGGLLRRRLEAEGAYELSALNRRAVEGVECLQVDIGDLEAIRPAFEGVDVVVHLSVQTTEEPWETLARTNLIGTYNVFEASRAAGVQRVVFASSGTAVRGFDRVAPYDALAKGERSRTPESWPMLTGESVWPRGIYGATKVWAEALGRHFSDAYGMSVLCVRLGSVYASNRPPKEPGYWAFLSHRDVVDILHRCIEAPGDLRYDIFFAKSRDPRGYRDLEHPRQVLGFEPQDSVDDFR